METTTSPLIVNNPGDKVLPDLARSLPPNANGPCVLPCITVLRRVLRLLADSQFADDLAISVRVTLFQVVKQTASLAHEHQKPAA